MRSNAPNKGPPAQSEFARPADFQSSFQLYATRTAIIMCELLALSLSRPAQLTFSLHALASHGSEGYPSRDGWGVAFFQGRDAALFREPSAAGDSELVRFLESHGPKTNLAISHIRHATQGAVNLANTQPFARALGARTHVFAHNGNLTGIGHAAAPLTAACQPVGETDSEWAFCDLLSRLQSLWQGEAVPSLAVRLKVISTFAADMRLLGPANFLYADGDALFAHGHRRWNARSKQATPPGLWMLQRRCSPGEGISSHSTGVSADDGENQSLLFASVPLSEHAWEPLDEGAVVAVRDGVVTR